MVILHFVAMAIFGLLRTLNAAARQLQKKYLVFLHCPGTSPNATLRDFDIASMKNDRDVPWNKIPAESSQFTAIMMIAPSISSELLKYWSGDTGTHLFVSYFLILPFFQLFRCHLFLAILEDHVFCA